MLTFSGHVKYLDHESHIKIRDKHTSRFCTIRVKDIDTQRVYCLYDWSGKTHTATLMRNHRHEVLHVQGYLNSGGKMCYMVLQRWGVWDVSRGLTMHPVASKPGYIEVIGGGKKK